MGCIAQALSPWLCKKSVNSGDGLVGSPVCSQPDAVAEDQPSSMDGSEQLAPLVEDSAVDIVEEQQPPAPESRKRVSWAQPLVTAKVPSWKLKAQARSAAARSNKRVAQQQLSSVRQKMLKARLRNSGTKWDNQDRMLDKAEFNSLQRMVGLRFTLDACCNPDGSNALVPEHFKSAEDSFLEYDCSGQHVWMNPPYADITPFVKHYVECKAKAPHKTSAVIVLPKWKGSHTKYLQSMHLIKEYPKGSRIFSAPAEGSSAERVPLGPTPWPVQVFYDPPVAVPLACLADLPVLDDEADNRQDHSQSELDCVHLQARANGANLRCLVDSGASHNLLSSRSCKANGIVVAPAPQQVELADGTSIQVQGVCNVRLQIGQYKAVVKCWVTALHPAYDLILGRTWMKLSKAILNAADNTLSVETAKGRVVLGHKSEPEADRESPRRMQLLSVQQAKRAVKKRQAILVFLSEVSEQGKRVATTTDGLVPKKELDSILDRNADIFSEALKGLPPDRGDMENIIELLPGAVPKSVPQFRLTQAEREAITEYVKELLAAGLIEPSSSPWGAPVLFVPKKRGEGWKGLRLCIDYRMLNKQTIRNSFPMPRIDDLVDQLGQAKVFSSLDLTSGYWQCLLSKSDRPKTAFRTPFGLFQWRVAPMGLSNSPARFQSVMNRIFQPLLNKCVTVYLDDILVYSKTPEEHVQHLKAVFEILRENKFVVSREKSCFNLPEVNYLGHVVGRDGVKVDPKKVQAVQDWPKPETVTQVRSFIGFVNYFRRFIDHFADTARPLNELLRGARKKQAKVQWTSECQESFDKLKQALITAPVLAMPDFDKPFVVEADASDFCLGAVLLQDGHPVAYESRTLIPAERNYFAGERELCAVVHALKIWRCYLWGNKFTIKSDHEPLKWLQSKGTLSPRQARWCEFLSAYDYVWVYKKGETMMADALSRLPQPATCAAASLQSGECNPLKREVAAATKLDTWFDKPTNTRSLVKRGDCWYKGKRLVVPQSMRLKVMQELHDAPYSGHRGITKTVALISEHFWWPKMREEIQHHVRTCAICQLAKAKTARHGGELQPLPIPNDRWESISMDFITDLPCTPSGHDAILVFVDRLTRMVLFAPCTKDIDALGTAKLLRNYVFAQHGLPASIVSDRDSRFTSKVWSELMRLLGTRLDMSSAFHPQTDGLTERYNRVLEEYLRSYVSSTYDDWDEWLPLAQFAVNNSKQESLRETPFYLNFGRHPRTPATLVANSDNPGAEEFAVGLHEAIKKAKAALYAAQQRQKALVDGKARRVEFAVGEQVTLDTRNLTLKTTGPNKLMPKYVGPFKVLKRIGQVAYKLELPTTMKCHPVFHVSLLHKWHKDGRQQPHPPPLHVSDEDGTWCQIDAILDHKKVKRGRKQVDRYLVKWTGFGPEHNEWRDASEVTEVAIQAYWDRKRRVDQVAPARRRHGR